MTRLPFSSTSRPFLLTPTFHPFFSPLYLYSTLRASFPFRTSFSFPIPSTSFHTTPPILLSSSSFASSSSSSIPPYDPHTIEPRFKSIPMPRISSSSSSSSSSPTSPFYLLSMFPYPSGQLHMGHARVYTLADTLARYHRMLNKQVLLPMGWDAFGLPAENAANQHQIDPKRWTYQNIQHMKQQLQSLAIDFDWDREFATCDPTYYAHTQAIFKKLWETGFAYQKEAYVHWDPVDQTVLANEQVDALGRSWRSGAFVEKRKLKQWFLKITHFAEDLLQGLNQLDWPEEVKQMQRQWIGKSEGYEVQFYLHGSTYSSSSSTSVQSISVFTTKPETLLDVTFLAVCPTHPCLKAVPLPFQSKIASTAQHFLDQQLHSSSSFHTKNTSPKGAFTGLYAVHPITLQPLPVFVVNYVLDDYATGAIMGVPLHDTRDAKFAETHSLNEVSLHSSLFNLIQNDMLIKGPFQGQPPSEALHSFLQSSTHSTHFCSSKTYYKLKDWLISRQRQWGCPIPMIHCSQCGPVPSLHVVPQGLPVSTPNTVCPQCQGPAKYDSDTMDTFVDSSWYYLKYLEPTPKSSTSSFLSSFFPPVNSKLVQTWMPVDLYIGGIEHAILHLMYARFLSHWWHHHVFPLPFQGEPFRQLLTQGMVHHLTYRDAMSLKYVSPDQVDTTSNPPKTISTSTPVVVKYEKMSKSKFNGIAPQTCLEQHGSDALRAYLLGKAPASQVLLWNDRDLIGFHRWLAKVHCLVHTRVQAAAPFSDQLQELILNKIHFQHTMTTALTHSSNASEKELWKQCQEYKAKITKSLETTQRLNTIPSNLIKYTHSLSSFSLTSSSSFIYDVCLTDLLRLMAPVTPCLAQYLWTLIFPSPASLHSLLWQWPSTVDLSNSSSTLSSSLSSLPPSLKSDTATFSMGWNVVLQVNGQTKGKLTLPQKSDAEASSFLDQVKSTPFWHTYVQNEFIQDVLVLNRTKFTIVNCILKTGKDKKQGKEEVQMLNQV